MTAKSLNISVLFGIFNFGRSSIKPTRHYLEHHTNVDWKLVELAILSPTKIKPDTRYGKGRYAYIRSFKKFVVKAHVEIDTKERIWVINAFIDKRK